jgi:transposase/IS5 family transposase
MAQERLLPDDSGSETDLAADRAPSTGSWQARLKTPVRNQMEMMVRDLDSLIAEDHPVRAIWALVLRLDLSGFYAPIKAVLGGPGHPASDPRVLVALWIYACVEGVGSARRLDRLCREHDAFRWLCGGVPVNYHLLADFRVQYGSALDGLMTQVLAAMMAQGLVTLKRVSQDGMRVRASAGASSFRREKKLRECLAVAQAQVQALAGEVSNADQPISRRQEAARERAAREREARVQKALQELPKVQAAKTGRRKADEARVSTTDPEARVMKMPDGGFRPAYNMQLATAVGSQVVVGVAITNHGGDGHEAPPMLEQVQDRTGIKPDDYLVDGGFATLDAIDDLSRAGTTVYAPTQPPRGNKRTQAEPRPTDSPAVAEWRARMATEEAKSIYRDRAATSECVNGCLREHQGLQRFLVRGPAKVLCIALWMALAHNLLRWIAMAGQAC